MSRFKPHPPLFMGGLLKPSPDYLVKLDSLIGDEDDLIPVGPTETQNVGILRLWDETKEAQIRFVYKTTQTHKRSHLSIVTATVSLCSYSFSAHVKLLILLRTR